MVLPGFSGTILGRDNLAKRFGDFCANARVLEYTESDEQIQIIVTIALVSYAFGMVYENVQPSYCARSTGRDLWAFQRDGEKWMAMWRTMVDLKDARLTKL